MTHQTPPTRWFIVNPNAGSWEASREAVEAFCAARPGHDLKPTRKAGHAEQLARDAVRRGIGQVVSVGGDGTLHEVVNGLMACRLDKDCPRDALPCLGILPGGTGNDLGRTLGLPRDINEALRVLEEGAPHPIDVVRLERPGRPTRYMHNAATGGFSTVMAEKLGQSDKKKWGALSYVVAGIAALGEVPDFTVRIAVDDEPAWESDSCAVVVGNGRYAGGGLNLIPEAQLDDGRLDVMWVTACSTMERAETLAQFVTGSHTEGDGVEARRCRHVTIHADPAMTFNVDGEPIAETPVTFTIEPRALRVIVAPSNGKD